MEKVFTTRYGTLLRIYEREGEKYVRLSELAQGLGFAQYNADGTLANIITGLGLKAEKFGKYYELEMTAARKVVEAFIKNRGQRRQWDQEKLGKEILSKLKENQVGISLFKERAEPEPVGATTETLSNLEEVMSWAKAIAAEMGVSPREALQLAKELMT